MSNAIPQQPTQRNAKPIRSIPQPNPNRLLPSRIPHTRDENEAWIRARLRRASERSQSPQACKAVASSLTHEKEAPHEYIDAQVLPDGKTLHEEVGRERPREEPEIEQGAEPAVLRADEVEVVADSKDRGV
jgi:hypothetical protein